MCLISEPLLFVLALIDTGSLLFLLMYFLITLTDLECDYLNAQQCCSNLNSVLHPKFNLSQIKLTVFLLWKNMMIENGRWVVPKLMAHIFVELLLLSHGQLVLCLINLPMTLWLLFEYFGVPSGNMGVYDPTEIHNRGQLKRHTKACMIYLGYYLIFLVIYLYCMIIALLKGDPIYRDDTDFMDL